MTTGLDGTPTGTDPGAGGAGPPRDEALRLYESMVLIRRVEERLRDDSARISPRWRPVEPCRHPASSSRMRPSAASPASHSAH